MRLLQPLLPTDRFDRKDRAAAAVMWMVGVAQGFSQAQATATLPFTRAGLGMGESAISALLAVTRLAGFMAIALSLWADRRGRRRALITAYTVLLVASGASALAAEPWQYGVTQGVVRAATSGVSALGVVWLAEQLSTPVRAYGVSLYAAAGSLGAGLAILGLPMAEVDWRLPYVFTLTGILLLPFLVRRIEESPLLRPHGSHFGELRRTVRTRYFARAGLSSLLAASFSAFGIAFVTERLGGQLGLGTGQVVTLTLAGGTLGAVGFFIGGRLADSWGRRPTTIMALAAALVGGLGLYHLDNVGLLLAAFVVSSFGSFAYVPAATTHRAELFPTETRATGATTVAWIGTIGSAAGLGAGRLLIDRVGLAGTLDVLGLGVLAAMAITLFLPETKGSSLAAAQNPSGS
ncbi:MAG: MFS transporter [Actinomycetota bacterium]